MDTQKILKKRDKKEKKKHSKREQEKPVVQADSDNEEIQEQEVVEDVVEDKRDDVKLSTPSIVAEPASKSDKLDSESKHTTNLIYNRILLGRQVFRFTTLRTDVESSLGARIQNLH